MQVSRRVKQWTLFTGVLDVSMTYDETTSQDLQDVRRTEGILEIPLPIPGAPNIDPDVWKIGRPRVVDGSE